MAYESAVICKEVHLPITVESGNGLTLEEYKNRYGIDLTEIFNFRIEGDKSLEVRVKPFHKVWIYITNHDSEVFSQLMGNMVLANNGSVIDSEWDSGVTAAVTKFGAWDNVDTGYVGLLFVIPKDEELDIKNIKIKASVI